MWTEQKRNMLEWTNNSTKNYNFNDVTRENIKEHNLHSPKRPYPVGTQLARDVLWRSPKGPNFQDLQGTFRGLFDLIQQSLLYTSITVFYWKSKYAKVLNGDAHGTSTGPICRTSRGPDDGTFCGRPRDVGPTCSFKFNSETY